MTLTHLVSGATSGIGKAIAQRLSARGDRVIPIVRSPQQAASLGAERYVCCDLSEPHRVQAALRGFNDPVYSFIHCAATTLGRSLFDCRLEEVMALMNVNLLSPMVMCAELKKNIQPGGAIVLFTSQSAYRGGFDDAYNTSKGGINTLIKSMALKYAPLVRVFGIAPGITLDTRMTRERMADDLEPIRSQIPLKRFGEPGQIAELVECLIGTAGAYVTGAVFDVNGGYYLR